MKAGVFYNCFKLFHTTEMKIGCNVSYGLIKERERERERERAI